ncbi:para-aminobenzoate synthase component I [Kalymmatonema gypsitolerans NIES-4073]|nr:para-aminobenzoate synthase component I [Scytonema sp. NIES-4073]
MTKPWYWRSLPLKNRTGCDVFAALFRHTSTSLPKIATLLESPHATFDGSQLARYSICAGAPRIVDGVVQMWTPPLGQVLPFLEQLLHTTGHSDAAIAGGTEIPLHLPFTGGWLGWLGYDIAWEIEQLPRSKYDTLPFPVAFWYEPDCFTILDHWEQILWLAASDFARLDELEKKLQRQQDKEKIFAPLPPSSPRQSHGRGEPSHGEHLVREGFPEQATGVGAASLEEIPRRGAGSSSPPPPHFWTSQQEYEALVKRAKKYIQAGDIFQANLSLRFEAQTAASGWEIYGALQQINPSPFASYWQTPWGEVMSCSPERLVQLQRCPDGKLHVSTRPIAGTRSRGITPNSDQELAQDLLSSTKERAEHIMLVDLERNDLGRVCEWGSVAVDELLTIERYSHVMHLVSNIKGSLKSDCNAVDLIRAMFPGGTITGCPKVRCMEIIEELEPMRRSLFYGSCGYLDWRGNLDLNILIRTLLLSPSTRGDRGDKVDLETRKTIRNSPVFPHLTTPHTRTGATPCPTTPTSYSLLNTVWGQVGAGIVADSDPEREWYESLHKAQAQLKALTMVMSQQCISPES